MTPGHPGRAEWTCLTECDRASSVMTSHAMEPLSEPAPAVRRRCWSGLRGAHADAMAASVTVLYEATR